jgi:prepilin-type N-terminal cleavage/methylation domain-containing protein
MKNQISKKRQEGFTIIEVLIVLAIAGLIILIVFLAVPALQRNSRNTQRKNDVSNILGAVQEYSSNNSGKIPTTAAVITPNAKLSFFDPANVTVRCLQAVTVSTGSSACTAVTYAATQVDDNAIGVYVGAKCDAAGVNTTGAAMVTTTGASIRNLSVVTKVETSGASTWTCQES